MDEMTIQSVNQTVRTTVPVRSSTDAKLADERLERNTAEQSAKPVEKKPVEEPESKVVEKAVADMNHQVEKFSTKVGFSLDKESNQFKIIVTDKETGKVIRQIPAEEILALSKKMEEIAGIIFDEVG